MAPLEFGIAERLAMMGRLLGIASPDRPPVATKPKLMGSSPWEDSLVSSPGRRLWPATRWPWRTTGHEWRRSQTTASHGESIPSRTPDWPDLRPFQRRQVYPRTGQPRQICPAQRRLLHPPPAPPPT